MAPAAVFAAGVLAVAGRVGAEPHQQQQQQQQQNDAAAAWRAGERCGEGDTVRARFVLRLAPAQAAELEATFWAVSTPGDARYGAHLTRGELRRVVAAPEAALAAVHAWLRDEGVVGAVTAPTRDSVLAPMPCAAAERLLRTEFRVFRHPAQQGRLLRATRLYALPARVAAEVALVDNVFLLPLAGGVAVARGGGGAGARAFPPGHNCGGKCRAALTTPAVLAQAYKLGDRPTGAMKGTMAVAEFQTYSWDSGDLGKWGDACGVNATVDRMIGNNSEAQCRIPVSGNVFCGEALLDIQYIKAVGGSIPLTDIKNDDYSILDLGHQVVGLDDADRPDVISVSYGLDEGTYTGANETVRNIRRAYILSCNQQFQKLGALGVSVLVASGDQGVLGRAGTQGGVYHPEFPAASPYVTSVGGTDFAEKSVIGDETAWTEGGGGFSNDVVRPGYQHAAVDAYLAAAAADLPPASKWNRTGRGFPDVAALGGQKNPYCIRAGGIFSAVYGTSASSPVVAAVFARLNHIRLTAGKPTLGFLNPFIYSLNGRGFRDVTTGRNCGAPKCRGSDGFPASSSWDAATGWGTPDFEQLSALV